MKRVLVINGGSFVDSYLVPDIDNLSTAIEKFIGTENLDCTVDEFAKKVRNSESCWENVTIGDDECQVSLTLLNE